MSLVSRKSHRILRFNHLSRSLVRENAAYVHFLMEIGRLERFRDQLQAKRAYLTGVKLFSVESEIMFTQQGSRRLTRCVDQKCWLVKELKRIGNVAALWRQQNKLKHLKLQLYRERKHILHLNAKKNILKVRLDELSKGVARVTELIGKNIMKVEEIQVNINNIRDEKLDIMDNIAPEGGAQ